MRNSFSLYLEWTSEVTDFLHFLQHHIGVSHSSPQNVWHLISESDTQLSDGCFPWLLYYSRLTLLPAQHVILFPLLHPVHPLQSVHEIDCQRPFRTASIISPNGDRFCDGRDCSIQREYSIAVNLLPLPLRGPRSVFRGKPFGFAQFSNVTSESSFLCTHTETR